MNHQTAFDQFFIGMTFKGAVYYVASEDLFSNGWVSSLLRWLVAPIPIKKQTTPAATAQTTAMITAATIGIKLFGHLLVLQGNAARSEASIRASGFGRTNACQPG